MLRPFPGGAGDGIGQPVELILETIDMRGVLLVKDVEHDVVSPLLVLSLLPESRYVLNAPADGRLEIMMVLASREKDVLGACAGDSFAKGSLEVRDLARVVPRIALGPLVSR